jgi:hypothetical protein
MGKFCAYLGVGPEYGPASRVAANPKAKSSAVVDVHIRHKEIMPPYTV